MRLNKYLALHGGLSRRSADQAIESGQVTVNGLTATLGQEVSDSDEISLDNQPVKANAEIITIMLNKPIGYVCSRDGQGSATVYVLLPPELNNLKPVGRLDKNSSGLLLMTNDGQLAHELTHPKFAKTKRYRVRLDKPLVDRDFQQITETGVELEDGISRLQLTPEPEGTLIVAMSEGRNRQIRRTFESLGYRVRSLHRFEFGPYQLAELPIKHYQKLPTSGKLDKKQI